MPHKNIVSVTKYVVIETIYSSNHEELDDVKSKGEVISVKEMTSHEEVTYVKNSSSPTRLLFSLG
jgi:hypothetical protein